MEDQKKLDVGKIDFKVLPMGHAGDDPKYSELVQHVKHWRRLYRQQLDENERLRLKLARIQEDDA